jgi:hypothetical protein
VSEIIVGPGGKPLPQRKLTGLQRRRDKANDFSLRRKLVFQWLSAGATTTWICSAGAIIAHVIHEHQWWCGEQLVVRLDNCIFGLHRLKFADLHHRQLLRVHGPHDVVD